MVYIAGYCRFCTGCWQRVASLARCMQLVQRQLLNMINTTSFRCPRVKAAFSCFHWAVSHGLAPPVYTRRWLYSLTKPRYDVTASTLIGVRASLGALRGFLPIVASPWPLHAVWCISGGSKVVSIHLCFPSAFSVVGASLMQFLPTAAPLRPVTGGGVVPGRLLGL